MKKFLLLLALMASPVIFSVRALPAHAAEEAAKPDPDKEKAEAKKKEEEGGPEGEKEKPKEGGEKDEKKKTGNGDVTGGKFAGDPVYVRLAPIVLPVISSSNVEQLVTIQIAIEVKDFDAGDTLHTNMPKVMDALNRALYGGLEDGTARKGPMVNVDKVKAKATTALQNLMGSDNIKDVLIVNVSQRLLR